jgi:hypothetical protein
MWLPSGLTWFLEKILYRIEFGGLRVAQRSGCGDESNACERAQPMAKFHGFSVQKNVQPQI